MPLGYGFHPTNEELASGYLLGKVTQNPLPAETLLIQERNLYDEMELSEIFATAEDYTKLYFFTHLKKKTEKGSRIDRTVGKGTWRGVDKGMDIFDDHGRLLKNCVLCVIRRKLRDPIANRRRLQIEEDVPHYQYANWLCHCIGVRFRPSHQDLVSGYLLNKVTQNSLPVESVIVERNLYNESELFDIFAMIQNGDNFYFFTQLKKKSQKSSRINRTVGNGCWRALDKGEDIFNCKRRLIGRVRSLIYENKTLPDQDNVWSMKEYSLHGDSLQHQILLKDYVLCVIKRKTSNSPGLKRRRLMKKEVFHDDEEGDCLQNKNNEINARKNELSIDDYMNYNEGITMAMPVSYFEDINNVAATVPQQEDIGTTYENPQSLSLDDESLLDEVSMFFEDFAAGPFTTCDDLFNIVQNGDDQKSGHDHHELSASDNGENTRGISTMAVPEGADLSASDYRENNGRISTVAVPDNDSKNIEQNLLQSPTFDDLFTDEVSRFLGDGTMEKPGKLHGEDDPISPKMKKN
ncbi:uncharacterized protein LOC127794422 [Diospyros lotus]|uniref:uncharacterized protein LOC127794422 n=1 Tax=Diospyros lotus TaxID=55363 RepID=UPI002256D6B3|nr:uncharacterized protein LOC127794422 [Diospyros lotus]